MNIFYKLLATVILIPIIGSVFICGTISLNEGKNLFTPYIDTEFASNYSPSKFELITSDLNHDNVISIIGSPIYKDTDTVNGQIQLKLNYTQDAYFLKKNKGKRLLISDFAWYRSIITFDTKGKILKINKGWNYD